MNLALYILCITLSVYSWILIARVILSFVVMFRGDWRPPVWLRPLVDLIYGLTEPPLQLIRRVVPQPMGLPLDLSFLVLWFIVGYILPIVIGCRG
ncbi:MAG: YggT family protein [Actinomycetota bacterium]